MRSAKTGLRVCLSFSRHSPLGHAADRWCCAVRRVHCFFFASFFKFPFGCIHRYLKVRTQKNRGISAKAAVYTAAILDFLTAEVLELAGALHALLSRATCSYTSCDEGSAPNDLRIKCITPRHLQLTVQGDEQLGLLVKATRPSSGVKPFIHTTLTIGRSRTGHLHNVPIGDLIPHGQK
jgi:histone H2A